MSYLLGRDLSARVTLMEVLDFDDVNCATKTTGLAVEFPSLNIENEFTAKVPAESVEAKMFEDPFYDDEVDAHEEGSYALEEFVAAMDSNQQPVPEQQATPATSSNEQLIRSLGSSHYARRAQAFNELAQRGLCALPELLNAQNSADIDIRRRAQRLIDDLGPEAFPYLVSGAESDDRQLSRSAQSALRRLSVGTVLNYAVEEPEIARRIVPQTPELEADIIAMGNQEQFGNQPWGIEALTQSLGAAILRNDTVTAFHRSLSLGRAHFGANNASAGIRALERCIQTVEQNRDSFTNLHPMDFSQQVLDILNHKSLSGQVRTRLSQLREQMEQSTRKNEGVQPAEEPLPPKAQVSGHFLPFHDPAI